MYLRKQANIKLLAPAFHSLSRYHKTSAGVAVILQKQDAGRRYANSPCRSPGRDSVVEQHKAVVDAREARVSDAANAMHDHLNLVLPVVQR